MNDQNDLNDVMSKRGALDFLSLPLFSTNAACASLMRAQQAEIQSIFSEVLRVVADRDRNVIEVALIARNFLTKLSAGIALHLSLEESQIRKSIAKDPRTRSMASQFDRETGALRSSFANFLRAYPTSSSIFENFPAFNEDLIKQDDAIVECFKVKDRELYPAYEKLIDHG